MTDLLEVSDLSVDFLTHRGMVRVLHEATISVGRGETLCVVGESGCGKSTTALAVMDLLPTNSRRSANNITFEGHDLLKIGRHRMNALRGNRLSMIFQDPMTSLNPSLTIGDQLEEVMRRHKHVRRGVARDRAVELLERTGVGSAAQRLHQYPHQLSGGLRQRVMIAMALMCSPGLLIADEPTTALDVTVQVQILRLLKELTQELRMGLLLITHDLGVVAHMADRVVVMYAGRIVESGAVKSVISDARHPYTKALLACIPRRGGRGKPLGAIPGSATPASGNGGCPFRCRCNDFAPVCETGPLPTFEPSPSHCYVCRLGPQP